MADFSDKKLRTAFEGVIKTASAEDLATLAAAIKPLLERALERIKQLSNSSITELDPLPIKPPKADE